MPTKAKIKPYKEIDSDVLTLVEEEAYQLRIGENPEDIDLDVIDKINVWDKSIKVEENGYYWKGEPFITKGKLPANDKPLVVELFCGCGGTSLGFELAGFEIAIGCDIHQPSINTFKTNHPNVSTVLGDVRKVNPKSFLQLLDGRQVDVLIGGVPCQGFSLNNRKRHEDDERNLLYKEFIRFVKSLKPKVVVLENVSGMKSTGDFVKTIEKDLSLAGNMKAKSKLLFAPDYGVPQSRTRLVFVGIRDGEEFDFSEIKKTHGPETKKPYVTVKDAIGDLPSLKPNEIITKYKKEPFSEYQKQMRKNLKVDKLTNHKAPNHPKEVIEKIKNTKPGTPMYPKFKQRIRLAWDIQSPTQVSGGIRPQFQFGHPSDNRGLSIRERCRLQSFPDNNLGVPLTGRAFRSNLFVRTSQKRISTSIPNATQLMKNIILPDSFIPGEIYTNDQIFKWFGVANSGGIRPSIGEKGKLEFIVLMTTKEGANYKFVNPYSDKIEDGILVYTGAGSAGDQTLSGVNKRITEQLDNPVPIVFFVKEARGAIRFVGYLLLLRHFEDYQLDSYRSVRKVQVFEFKILENVQPVKKNSFKELFSEYYFDFKNKADKNDLQIFEPVSEGLNMELLVEKEILRNKLLSINPYDFEEVMAALVKHTGFNNVEVTKKSGDGGIDIKANLEHHFSPEIEFIFQVKRWRHSVGRPDIANLRGSIGYNNFGVMISTSHFTKSAITEANADEKKPINLVGIDLLHTIIKTTDFKLAI